jgi:glucose-1-phosphate thymidylyltransferase
VEERQGIMISSPEEIAFRKSFIDRVQLKKLASEMDQNGYGTYLSALADGEFQ